MTDLLSWDDVRVFLAVAQELSFTRAAQRLHTAQPALSRRVARMEARLKVRLLDRNSRRVTLTPAGRSLLAHAKTMAAAFDAACVEFTASGGSAPTQRLRVGLEWPLGVPALIEGLSQDGRIEVQHTVGGSAKHLDMLGSGGLDAVQGFVLPRVACAALATWPAQTIVHEPVWVQLPAAHPLAGRVSVGLVELTDQDWVSRPEHDPYWHFLLDTCERAGFAPRIVHTSDNSVVLADYVEDGCVALGVPADPPRRAVTAVPLDDHITRRSFLAWNPATVPHAHAHAMTATFRRHYRAQIQAGMPRYWDWITTHPELFAELDPAR